METRFKDQEYRNWLKFGLGLNCLKDGLNNYMVHLSNDLHKNILQQSNVQSTERCQICKAKDIIIQNRQTCFKNGCSKNICDKLVKEIASQHIHGNKGGQAKVYWNNSNVQEWTHVPWEIAKIFMGQGQKKENKGPTQTDAANLLTYIDQCKFCRLDLGSKKLVKKIKEKRNKLMHSSNMNFSDQLLKEGLEDIVKFLQDSNISIERDAKQALKEVLELEQMDINVTTKDIQDKETAILHDKMKDLELRLQLIAEFRAAGALKEDEGANEESHDNELNMALLKTERDKFKKFVEDNHLALSEFSNFKEQTNKKIESIENRVDNLEDRVVKIEQGNGNCGDRRGFKSGRDYKHDLNCHGQSTGLQTKYNCKTDVSSGKWTATVTIDGKSYKSVDCYNTKREAEQEAAYQALDQLGYYSQTDHVMVSESPSQNMSAVSAAAQPAISSCLPTTAGSPLLVYDASSFSETDVLSDSTDNSSALPGQTYDVGCGKLLNELLTRSGFAPARYNIQNVDGKKQATATVIVTNIIALEKPCTGKKDAEHKVAEMILRELKAEIHENQSSFKASLHSYCGQQRLKMANFYTFEAKKTAGYGCIASMSALKGSRKVSAIGEIYSTDKECFESAAEIMHNHMKNVEFESIVTQNKLHNNGASNIICESTPKPVIPPAPCGQSENNSPIHALSPPVSDSDVNCISLFNEYIQKSHLSCTPEFSFKEDINGKSKIFKGVISKFRPKFQLPIDVNQSLPSNKKEAEKDLATYVLTQVFNIDNTDRNFVKNKLQEECVKLCKDNIPTYETEHTEIGCTSKVTFTLEVIGNEWHNGKPKAKNEVAKKALQIVGEV